MFFLKGNIDYLYFGAPQALTKVIRLEIFHKVLRRSPSVSTSKDEDTDDLASEVETDQTRHETRTKTAGAGGAAVIRFRKIQLFASRFSFKLFSLPSKSSGFVFEYFYLRESLLVKILLAHSLGLAIQRRRHFYRVT